MDKETWILILSILSAILALLSPIIVAKVNNRARLREKHMEFIYKEKRDTYLHFLSFYGRIQYRNPQDNLPQDFFSALYCVLLLCNEKTQTELLKLNEQIKRNECFSSEETLPQFTKCCDLLREDLIQERKRNKY